MKINADYTFNAYIIRAPLSIFTSLRKRFPESFIPNNLSNHKIFVGKQINSALQRNAEKVKSTYHCCFIRLTSIIRL